MLPEFQPQWDARKGAQASSTRHTGRSGSELSDFEGPRYRRIDQIKQLIAAGEPRPRPPLEERARRLRGEGTTYVRDQVPPGPAASPARRRSATPSSTWGCRRSARASSPPRSSNQMEPFYPLHVYVCEKCFLVQLEEFVSPEEIFTEYAYFSSYADSWVEHMRRYAEMISDRLGLGQAEPRGGGGEQRRLPAAALREEGDSGPRHRARGQRGQGGDREGHPHPGGVLRRGARRASWPPRASRRT